MKKIDASLFQDSSVTRPRKDIDKSLSRICNAGSPAF